jgi:hypothetical protein
MSSDDFITQAEAARLRQVSRAAISDLIKRGKLKVHPKFGLPLLSRREVLSYRPEVGGRPPSKKSKV